MPRSAKNEGSFHARGEGAGGGSGGSDSGSEAIGRGSERRDRQRGGIGAVGMERAVQAVQVYAYDQANG